MDDWIDLAARALQQEHLAPSEIAMVLRLARDVSRGVERRTAPLAAYLAGIAVGRATAVDGRDGDRVAALRDATRSLSSLIPAPADPNGREEGRPGHEPPSAETERPGHPAG